MRYIFPALFLAVCLVSAASAQTPPAPKWELVWTPTVALGEERPETPNVQRSAKLFHSEKDCKAERARLWFYPPRPTVQVAILDPDGNEITKVSITDSTDDRNGHTAVCEPVVEPE